MQIREAVKEDLPGLLALYAELHPQEAAALSPQSASGAWARILADAGQHVLIAEADGLLVSTCVAVIVPNLTHGQRPYCLIENVATHHLYRQRGYAGMVLQHAVALAARQNCYKVMLLTGAKEESTLRFYEKAGFNRRDKTAFVRWL